MDIILYIGQTVIFLGVYVFRLGYLITKIANRTLEDYFYKEFDRETRVYYFIVLILGFLPVVGLIVSVVAYVGLQSEFRRELEEKKLNNPKRKKKEISLLRKSIKYIDKKIFK